MQGYIINLKSFGRCHCSFPAKNWWRYLTRSVEKWNSDTIPKNVRFYLKICDLLCRAAAPQIAQT